MECSILLGGEAGKGMLSVEHGLTKELVAQGYYCFTTKNYMSRIRGGHNYHMLRVADAPVTALRDLSWDIVVAYDEQSKQFHSSEILPQTIMLRPEHIKKIEEYVKEKGLPLKTSNEIIIQILLYLIGAQNSDQWREYVKGFCIDGNWQSKTIIPQKKVRQALNGNEALVLGAIAGGCQFCAGYPMTPATSILDYYSQLSSELPIIFEQAEDEIAAINMAIGASYAGLRSMVATSGGGFSLMQEGVSLAAMTETPMVIIDGQRPAPATGLPTRTEQADLNLVMYSGHGEFPRVVYAPGSIEECYDIGREAMTMADQIQSPVFILTDQYLADSIVTTDPWKITCVSREYKTYGAEYQRYALATPVSPITYPGLSESLVQADSDEHDEFGQITEDLRLRVRMQDKRMAKQNQISFRMPSLSGDEQSSTVIISWGSNKLIVAEAVQELNKQGVSCQSVHFSQVYPLDQKVIDTFSGKTCVVVENNFTGQFSEVLHKYNLPIQHRILKYDGACFTVQEIISKIKEIV